MGSVNITIKDEAYEYLKSLKGENQSFSDVILALKRARKPMTIREAALTYGGGISSEEAEAWKERIRKSREIDEVKRRDRFR